MRVFVVILAALAATTVLAQRSRANEESSADEAIDAPNMQLRRPLHPLSPSPIPRILMTEPRMPHKVAGSKDGRLDMGPTVETPFDDDCDSPQIGEAEPWPNKAQVDMKEGSPESHGQMKEQSESSRQVMLDKNDTVPTSDDALSMGDQGGSAETPKDQVADLRSETLPEPSASTKCSRSRNSHDVPDPLELMDDDCGMPEPDIPCETVGNSTECEKQAPPIQLNPPEIPTPELMPPLVIEIPKVEFKSSNVSVEFVDLGLTRQAFANHDDNVGQVIDRAGEEFGISSWAAQLIRSASSDIPATTLVRDLEDQHQLIVYLTCIARRFKHQLIVDIPACEDLAVSRILVRIEIPAFNNLSFANVNSNDRVQDAIVVANLDLANIERITYDGQEVSPETALEDLSFRDNSVLVVYPKEPCPSQSPSSSPSPTASPSLTSSPSTTPTSSPSVTPLPPVPKIRKTGAYDAYRHCRNANGDKPRPPPPEALGLDPASDPNDMANNATYNCEESEMTEVEIVEPSPQPAPSPRESPPPRAPDRQPMTKDAKILVDIDHRLIPVLIKPQSKGIDIFDAVKRATGQEHEYMIGLFLNRKIDHYTPLKPFGFVENDVVRVVSPQAPKDVPRAIQSH